MELVRDHAGSGLLRSVETLLRTEFVHLAQQLAMP
jgi:hypothetical protein